ncbi:MAG: cellulase family glycosylhydrolase [Kiritimatiellae bacterium]|nr:cellulase family glycosylhydrolase [Kiritimatiellia bacterium]
MNKTLLIRTSRFFASFFLAVFAFEPSALSAPLREISSRDLNWKLPKGARIEGDRLIAEIPAEDGPGNIWCAATLDISEALAAMKCVAAHARFRAENISEPKEPWQGVKVQFMFESPTGAGRIYRSVNTARGTYGWTNVTTRVSPLRDSSVKDGVVTFILGMEACTGRAEFDLSALRIEYEDCGIPIVNQDWVVRYPEAVQGAAPLRGCMLPARATTEDDIETLHQWGATMARFQIMRRFLAVEDNQDLPEYWAWVDKRLDNLENVLKWAQARGMKICVDLHSFPGGLRASDRDSNMLHDKKWADAFVKTWRRIATRFNGHPALYGYDLVNEPKQISYAPINYWEIQRRAAEAIREIDKVTPIVVESNMGASPGAFRYLSPLAMDNVIYQCHFYAPQPFTHQGVATNARKHNGKIPFWPDPSKGWDRDYIRNAVKQVRIFQEKHKCRIYVGEFSAVGYAPGADQWIRDAISVFEEYGWDWTYHAFREWAGWSVEHEAENPNAEHPDKYRRVNDTPRKRALLDGFNLGRTSAKTLFFAGDSTLDEHGGDESTYGSWGAALRPSLREGCSIVNYGRSGRSTTSFRREGRWDKILAELTPGDFVVIQFGHNDQKLDKPDVATPIPEYKANLARMADEVRAKGATPVFATPIVRLTFKDGALCDPAHLDDWAAAMRETAAEKDVALVDMRALTRKAASEAGEKEALTWNAPNDRTHPAPKGARLYAYLFLREIRRLSLPVAELFENEDMQ